ncbi:hypothetical protein [Eikenella corrodens]|uniref:Uncharacterized protein n=2 Tax=Eikenella corrodens TaxID=539 RepID=A0A1A9RHT6_EIKCO|nr:hypothetical protein [Eikenella corrodens]OAM17808.1 hypothetical protein A7P90_08875 [Eikenella corrodens]
MGQQEKLENKMAICQAMDGQPPLRIERLAQLSGVSGRDLTDALVELEGVGAVVSTPKGGKMVYSLASAKPVSDKKPTGKSEKEMRENVLRYFKGRPGQDVSTRSINAMLGSYQAGTSVLNKLKEDGLIERSGHGIWRLVGGLPENQDGGQPVTPQTVVLAEMATEPAVQPQSKEDDTVVLTAANADEKPSDEHDIKIGGFSDGSFSIDKGNGLWKMQLSRGQMLKVVGFVEKFLAMEGV